MYLNLKTNEEVPEEEAFEYAVKNASEEEKEEIVEYYFSGNWIRKDEEIEEESYSYEDPEYLLSEMRKEAYIYGIERTC